MYDPATNTWTSRSAMPTTRNHAFSGVVNGKIYVIGGRLGAGTVAASNSPAKRNELKASVELTHGSLLIMRGGTQANWLHQIPKTAKPVQERLNLTFRAIVAPAR
jgi:hypothetical protein